MFLNPPWSTNGNGDAKHDWLRKAIAEAHRDEVTRVVMLLPVDTSTQWFHEHVTQAAAICFCGPGRVSFEGCGRNPSFGLMILVFGELNDALKDTLAGFGAVFAGGALHEKTEQARFGGSLVK